MPSSVATTIEVIFHGTDELSSVTGDVGRELRSFDASVQSMAEPLSNAADSILKIDAAIAALVAGGMALAINQAGKFGDSFAEVSTLINDTASNLSTFETDILAYSRSSTASIEDIVSATYTAISAGTDYKDSLDILNTSEKLSVAGKADLEATTRVLVSSLNAYGESTDKAAEFSDALFLAVKQGQTTLPELANSLAQVTTTAANSGVSFDELMASIAAVTATGAPTAQAVTAVKSAISAIVKPTSEASEEAARLGIGFNAAALETKGLNGVLKDVFAATGGATGEIVKLFGSVESLPAVLTLGADASGKFASTLEEFANKAGATAAAYEKMAENFQFVNQKLANNVRITFIEAGQKMLGSYADIVGDLTSVFASVGFSINAGAFDDIFRELDAFGGDVSEFFSSLADSLPYALERVDWSGLLDALGDLGESIGLMFEGFDPSSPIDVADAIQTVVDSAESLVRVTEGMVESFKPFVEAIMNSIAAFNAMDEADKRSAGNILGLAKALTTLGTGLTVLLLLIGDNAKQIEALFNAIAGVIKIAWGGFAAGMQVISLSVLSEIDIILGAIETVSFGKWKEKIQGARSGIQEEMAGMKDRLLGNIDTVHSGWDQLTDAFGEEKTIELSIKSPDMKSLQNEWDEITNEIDRSDVRMEVKTNFKEIQSDWDAISSEIGDGEATKSEITIGKTSIKVEPDEESIKDTKKKIKKELSPASMGPIGVGITLNATGPNGVGPVGDVLKSQLEEATEAMDFNFDLEGLASLIESTKGLGDNKQAKAAVEAQLRLMEAAALKTEAAAKAMNVAANLQFQAANIMTSTSEGDKTIYLDAAGVEPEIEAFMYKILKKIQVRANESGAEFLLAAT